MPQSTRPVRRDELAEACGRALIVLDRAIADIDAGDRLGFDTAVQRLRLLVGTGRGNELLRRTSAAFGAFLDPLQVPVPPPGDGEGLNLTFAIENLPADSAVYTRGPLEEVALGALMRRDVLAVGPHFGSDERLTAAAAHLTSYTWNSLLNAVANKLGPVHLDDEVPKAFDDIAHYATLDLNPAAYALRALAIGVVRSGTSLLRSIQVDHPTSPRSFIVSGRWLGRLRVWGRVGGMVRMDVLCGGRRGEEQQPFRWTAGEPPQWP